MKTFYEYIDIFENRQLVEVGGVMQNLKQGFAAGRTATMPQAQAQTQGDQEEDEHLPTKSHTECSERKYIKNVGR